MTEQSLLRAEADTPDPVRVLTNLTPTTDLASDPYPPGYSGSETPAFTPRSGRGRSRSRKSVARRTVDPASISTATIAVGIGPLRVGVSFWARRIAP